MLKNCAVLVDYYQCSVDKNLSNKNLMENDYENIIFLYNFVYFEIDDIIDVGSVQECKTRHTDHTDEIWSIARIDTAIG